LASYYIREYFVDLNKDEVKEKINEILTYSDGEIKLIDYNIENLNGIEQPVVINMEYTIDNLVMMTPDEIIFQTGGLFSPSSLKKYMIDTDKRNNPIKIYSPENYIKNITINHPRTWHIDNSFAINHANDFASIEGKYNSNPGCLKVTQNRLLNACIQPKERIDDLLQITGSKSKLYIPTIIFSVQEEQ